MKNNLSFIILIGILIGLTTEYLAPILDKKFNISSFIDGQFETNTSTEKFDQSTVQNDSKDYSDYKTVKSSSGHKLKIHNTCSIGYQSDTQKLIDDELKSKDITLSDGNKLNAMEIDDSNRLMTDVINCENINATWNIIKIRYDYMDSIDEDNLMDTCISLGEGINFIYHGKAKIFKCELEEGTRGSNNLYTEFEGYDEDGKFKRFVHNFYHDKIFYNIFGQCALNSPECSSVKHMTKMIAYSYDQINK
tara:strand:+ start:306 stop:1052 length:747 start_codon:yes stop_codon:yes gene_type:complete